MLSRLIQPDQMGSVGPVNWQQVRQAEVEAAVTAEEPRQHMSAQLAQLEGEHRQGLAEAHSAGVREGEAAGRARAAGELQPVLERLSRTIDELSQTRARLRREAEADMVKLSLEIARRVLRRELAVDPEALHGLVLAALERLQGQEISRVKIHPQHAGVVRSLLQKSSTGVVIEVVPDASQVLGTVIFETPRGNLDASVDSQLQEIERGLADCLRKNS
jgi:flagellar assembly protein FliH